MAKTEFDSLNKEVLLKRGVTFGYRLNSPTSQAFVVGTGRIERRDFLINAFDLKDKARFIEKYEEASTGSGNPYKDFDALRSSALCALLSFYGIKDLVIDDVHYDKAFFEFQNTVIENERPSNMDVVLVSKDNKVILFLECKFSEYKTNNIQNIPNSYLSSCSLSQNLYVLLCTNGLAVINNGEKEFQFLTKEAYSQGTKQVISHLVGITSFINRKDGYSNRFKFYSDSDARKKLYDMKFERVIFKEVLFKLEGYEKHLEKYFSFSEKVRKAIIQSGLISGIEFSPATTYQDIFKGNNLINVDELVALFYRYKESE